MRNVTLKILGLLAVTITTAAWAAEQPLRVDESHAKEYWVATKSILKGRPLVPGDMRRAGAGGCVTVGYTIDADGNVVDAKTLRSYITKKDGDEMRAHFEKAVAANISGHRYVPAATNAQHLPISTFVTIVVTAGMGLPRKSQLDEISEHCKVENFAATSADTTQRVQHK